MNDFDVKIYGSRRQVSRFLQAAYFFGGGGGGSTQEQSTDYRRSGGSSQSSSTSLPSNLSGYLSNSIQSYGGTDDKAKSYLHRLVGQDNTLPGYSNLMTAATLDPLSTGYETSTQATFDNRLQKSLAAARSGFENANAPLNRGKEFREAEVIGQASRDRNKEIRDQRLADFGILTGANQALNGQGLQAADILERGKTADTMSLHSLAELLGSKSQSTSENFSGLGSQQATGYSYGAGAGTNMCCFIFLEAYNGVLPFWVRECRDEFYTPRKRSGYVRMSSWLVPAMRRSRTVRILVNVLMVKPLTNWGGFYKKVSGYESYAYLRPVVSFWFRVWDIIGKDK